MEPNKTNFSMIWVAGGIVIIVGIIVAIYFATRTPQTSEMSNADTVGLNDGVDLGADRVSVNATAKSLEVMNLGTFPYKVQSKVSLDLPNSCSSASANVVQSGKVFTVTTTASQPKDAMCAEVITPTTVTVDIPVAGLAAGTYTVKYEEMTKTFTLAQNNSVDYMTGDK